MVPVHHHVNYRRAYFTCGGLILVALWLLLGGKKPQINQGLDQSLEQSRDPSKLKPPSYAHRNYDHPSEEEHRTQEQLSWRNSFTLNVCIAVAAIGGFLAAGGTLIYTRIQANAAEQTLRDGRGSSRPYLIAGISSDIRRFNLQPNQHVADLGYYFTNYGSTPAIVIDDRFYYNSAKDFHTFDQLYNRDIEEVHNAVSGKDVVIKAGDFGDQGGSTIDIKAGSTTYFGEKLIYQDFFGGQYFTNFCYRFDSATGISKRVEGGKSCNNNRS